MLTEIWLAAITTYLAYQRLSQRDVRYFLHGTPWYEWGDDNNLHLVRPPRFSGIRSRIRAMLT